MLRNTDPLQPWNDPIHHNDPFAPHNDPMGHWDPFKAWNDPCGVEQDMEKDEQDYYRR